MAKDKQRKKKERERRVAQEKLAAAARKRAQSKTTKETSQTDSRTKKLMESAALPKTKHIPTNKKNPFTQRRSGG
jgi:hypothetical protein